MTDGHKIAENGLVLACDAAKALFLRNIGTVPEPSLTVEKVLEAEHVGEPKNADRPGRMPDHGAAGAQKGPRSAMEEPNWQKLDADAFAVEICRELQALHRKGALADLVLAAPPDMLGFLRRHMPDEVAPAIRAELRKDLTGMPIDRLTDVIAGH